MYLTKQEWGENLIGVYDADGSIPNNAFLKITSFFKNVGEPIEFIREGRTYSKIYGSAILTSSKPLLRKLIEAYPKSDVLLGGPGWILGVDQNGKLFKENDVALPEEIEKMKPDYSLYTYQYWYNRLKHSKITEKKRREEAKYLSEVGVGFTRRSCPNIDMCEFCGVRLLEPVSCKDQEIKDIINPKSNKIILLDNNFTQDPDMEEKSKEIAERGLEVDICQGVNVRIMTDEKAHWLNQMKHSKQIRIAWDNPEEEEKVMRGIKILLKFFKPYKIMCYVLVGFDTTMEEDLYRVYKLQELGLSPYVMTYNNRKDGYWSILERWCNTIPPVRKVAPFHEFKDYINYQQTQLQVSLEQYQNQIGIA